jgi:hypothetical protein
MSERWERNPEDLNSWPRLFTVAEANALLPEIVPLLMEIRARKVELDTALAALEKMTAAMRLNGHAAEARELEVRIHELTTELAAGVEHLNDQGIEIKSLDHGLIDFPPGRAIGWSISVGVWGRGHDSVSGTRSTPASRAGGGCRRG